LSTLELNAEIEQALQENPCWNATSQAKPTLFSLGPSGNDAVTPQTVTPTESDDREERIPLAVVTTKAGAWTSSGSHGQRDPNDDDTDAGETQASSSSLREHLGAQVAMTQLPAARPGAGRLPDRSTRVTTAT
jgi:DNA-directed RNA polymerase specialized sigma54-like protein